MINSADLKLFAVLLGGRAPGCHVELHDVVFTVGTSLEACYPKLVNKWFGSEHRLHIDASVELRYVDHHEVIIDSQSTASNDQGLYFINFGGYKEGYFGEIHEANFYVAESKTAALYRAKTELCIDSIVPHCDDNLLIAEHVNSYPNHHDIDDLFKVHQVDNFYIHLKPTTINQPLKVHAEYRKLDLPEIMAQAKNLRLTPA